MITSDQQGVEVAINGQGRRTLPITLENLPAGTYQVEASREGYLSWRGEVEVKPGAETRLPVKLHSTGEVRHGPGFFESLRWPTFVAAGAGVVCLVAGAGFAAHMAQQEDLLAQVEPVDLAAIQQMQEHRDAGQRSALAANIMFGVGGAARVAAAVLAVLDYTGAEVRDGQVALLTF